MATLEAEPEQEKLETERLLRDDTRFAAGRIAATQYVVFAVFLFLISGFWELQIHRRDYYSESAERNRIKSLPVIAPRGKILDRDGRVIVDNRASFSLILSREALRPEHLAPIAAGLNLDLQELEEKLRRYERTRPKYEPVVLKEELTPAELAFVESHRDAETFPELELVPSHMRYYPQEGLAAHAIGYVGEITEAELNSEEFLRYRPGDMIGKAGIERQYNDHLAGIDGQRRVMVDNRGRERQLLGYKPAVPGQNLQLTLDLDLQVVAELALEGKSGAVVALDPRNGEVLAMASRPAFDPNKFAGRISAKDWKELINDPSRPLLNRAIQAQFAPGSTFKPIMAIAALEEGALDDHFTAHCSGSAVFYGRPFRCHLKRGHGAVQLYKGIVASCDVFFYNVGNRLGIDTIAKYAQMAGLGQKTGIDLPHEAEGTVPSTKWKLRMFRQKWYAGETISVAIGQGALTVTPLQLAHAIGGLVMGGIWHRPHLVKESASQAPARQADLKPENVAKVIEAMYGVVNAGGTAARSRIPGIEFCGKTGTAQLASAQFVKSSKDAKSYADNAWFVGFAPKHNPEIVVAALYEHGEHGDQAAPIVRDVIKAYFDKQARLRAQGGMPAMRASAAQEGR